MPLEKPYKSLDFHNLIIWTFITNEKVQQCTAKYKNVHTGNNLLKIREFWYIPKNHFFDLSPTGLFFKIENIDFIKKISKCIKK